MRQSKVTNALTSILVLPTNPPMPPMPVLHQPKHTNAAKAAWPNPHLHKRTKCKAQRAARKLNRK